MTEKVSIEEFVRLCGDQPALSVEAGHITSVSTGYLNLFNLTGNEDILNAPVESVLQIDSVSTGQKIMGLLRSPDSSKCRVNITRICWPGEDNTYVYLIYPEKEYAAVCIDELAYSDLQERYYQGIVEDQTELIDRYLPDGTLTFVNKAICRFFNRSKDELLGYCMFDSLSEADASALKASLLKLTPENPAVSSLERVIGPDNKIAWIRWTNRGIFQPDGKLVEYQAVGRDETQTVLATEALQESERRFRTTFTNAPVGMLQFDNRGRCLDSNAALQEMLGYTADELKGLTFKAITVPEEIPRGDALVRDMISGISDGFNFETRYLHKDGSTIWGKASISCIRDENGIISFVVATIENITDLRKTQMALVESEQFNRAVIDEAGEGIVVYDRDGNILVWNRFMSNLVHIKSSDVIENGVLGKFWFFETEENRQFFDDVLNQGEIREVEIEYKNTRSGLRHLLATLGPHRNSRGKINGIIQIVRDVSTSKQFENELQIALDNLEKACRLQREFLNNVTHEVRTPLTAVQGYVRMLLEGVAGEMSEMQANLLQRVLSSSDQLLEMVSSVLEVSKSRSGSITLSPRACKPDMVLEKAISSVAPQASEKGLAVITDLPECMMQLYDEQKLTMVLLNLLANAVKFTEKGYVEASISEYEGGVEVVIADSGAGISNEKLDTIFEEFVQLDYPGKHKPTGFGLGLAIVASMVDAMGASLIVSSEKGTGTAFTLKLPALSPS